MSASPDEIDAALFGALTAVWDATPVANIALPNNGFAPADLPSGSSYMEMEVVGGTDATRTMTCDLTTGIRVLEISAHTPLGVGKSLAAGLIASAVSIFQGQRIVAGTSSLVFKNASAPMPLPKDGWFKLTVRLTFQLI